MYFVSLCAKKQGVVGMTKIGLNDEREKKKGSLAFGCLVRPGLYAMFEKSLYDLIRGLRSHKGNERQYMLDSLKECRNEAKSQDIDIKAAAILKLVYLEMFGHDMSWASFHVLEVMSSSKFMQKRVGYLAAVQSFTLDTDVLMLTTNLLKKDLSSHYLPETSLAINGVSHIVSPSLARDLSPDLLSKLSHTSPHIRKKAVLVLYKCFLQSPELLRTSWPRLRECLSDEDGSVVSATVNVVCELARRNPRNYLPLAPQLFKLLTDGGNNWMTIKLIKLFATLTPLEPRLIKKLIPPITTLIRTTPAMSLLYECISGLISGGLLSNIIDTPSGDDIASVCVSKLRGFLVVGDSNLKYVGLLALTKLVGAHAHLVAEHADVVLDCVDDDDISIRYRALELVVGMVDAETLQGVVGRLLRQLKKGGEGEGEEYVELEVAEESEDEDMEEGVMHGGKRRGQLVVLELPEAYKRTVIKRIIEMCARDMYVNVSDFEWYLDVLVQLVRHAPPVGSFAGEVTDDDSDDGEPNEDSREDEDGDVGEVIGRELRNVAVRVKSVRAEAVRYAEMLVARRDGMFPAAGGGGKRVLEAASWIVGEFSSLLTDPSQTLSALLHSTSPLLPPDILAVYIQSIPKIYASLTGSESIPWIPARKSTVTLLTSRIIAFLSPLAISPNLEVQERSVEFLELFRLAAEAIAAQPASLPDAEEEYDPPLLLTQAIPAMFLGVELNPVAPRAQRKVPLPYGLDLDEPINSNLQQLLREAEYVDNALGTDDEDGDDSFREWYYTKPLPKTGAPASLGVDQAAAKAFGGVGGGIGSGSYQGAVREEEYLDKDILERRRRDRREREKDDPFYIGVAGGEGEEVDIDSIPVMKLDLGDVALPSSAQPAKTKRRRVKVTIAADEGIAGDDGDLGDEDLEQEQMGRRKGKRKGLLGVDSSGLTGYSLEGGEGEEKKREIEEEKTARLEVERFRAEMERAAERVRASTSLNEEKRAKGKRVKKDKDAGEKGNKGKRKKDKEGKEVKKEKGKKKNEGATVEEGEKKKKKKKVKEEQLIES